MYLVFGVPLALKDRQIIMNRVILGIVKSNY